MTEFFRVDDQGLAFLKSQWEDLSSIYTLNATIKADSFQVLKEHYSSTSRFYHNLSHVKSLLNLFESLKDKVQDRNALRFAIWFHDVIYDTKRNDNEEQSAQLASQILEELQVEIDTIEFVKELILATKNHWGRNLSDDAKLFLDMDLGILGTSEEVYREYSKAIRTEYSWVSESEYRNGRAKILISFIERESIYFTDEMKARHEEQARENVNNEIKSLQKDISQ